MSRASQITVDNNGNITLPDGSKINPNQTETLLPTLNRLAPAHLAALQQIAELESGALDPHFKTLLTGLAAQKNIVGGNISNVEQVRIGDERHYHFYLVSAALPKELTSLIPRTPAQAMVGRRQDLADLQARLFDNKQVVLVNGLGGIGKTTLAQAYVDTCYERYRHIAWISQISDNIMADLVNTGGLLLSLGIDGRGKEQEALFHEIIIGLKRIEDRPNLLVIDNAAGPTLSRLYHYLPRQPHWHILVTSRQRIDRFELKELDFLSESEAMALFSKHYTRAQISEAAIKGLVQQVDYHTLTVEILAKTAQRQRLPAGRLQRAMADDLPANVNVGHAGGKIEKVRAYLESVFNLSDLSEAEIWLMKQFACLPPEYHPYDLLQALLRPEKSQYGAVFADTLAGLRDKGWLLQNRANDSFKMHRIIAEVTVRRHPPTPAEVEPLIAALTELLSLDQSKDNPIDKFPWIPFGQALLAHFPHETTASIATLQNNLALRLQDLGDYEGAKGLLEKALQSAEKNFGPDHPTTAVRYSNLALVLKDLGDYEGAKGLLEKALQSDEKNFGPDHPTTAVRYSNLATVLKDLGDYEGALPLAAKALAIFKNRLPAGHPNIAVVSHIYQAIQNKLKS